MSNQNKQFFVYTHARPNTNDVHGIFYVGKGLLVRTKRITREHNNHHTNIVKKYGKENIIVRKLACKSEQYALDLEVKIIAKLREIGVKLVNFTDGGEGTSGCIPTQEMRLAHSIRMTGRKQSLETIEKRRASFTGHIKNKEWRENLSKAHIGKVFSTETREKIAESNRNRSPEVRARMSEAQRNRPPASEETRKKLSEKAKAMWVIKSASEDLKNSMLAGTRSKEAREKQAESMRISWAKRKAVKEALC
jgi:hypothetical protein